MARAGWHALVLVGAALSLTAPRASLAQSRPGDLPDVAGPKVVTKPPKLVQFVEAEYPPDKKAAGTTASVVLAIEIDEDGKVAGVTVTQSGGADFDAAAVAAARRFVFEPAEVDGRPAPVKITYRYAFTIKTETVKVGPQVTFEGVVLDRTTKRALAGVSVTVKDLGRTAITDAAGHFEFIDLPPGPHKIELSAPSLIAVSTEEELQKDKKRTVRYLVEPKSAGGDVDEEEVIRAARIRKESTEVEIRTEEARRVPGTQGDTLKVVQNLPGVARASFGSGQLVVWGSAPKDTRVYVDGVEVPSLYHLGGLRSVVNADLVKSIELIPGAYGAEYGRALGGLVRVETRALPPEGVHGYVAADLLDASSMLSVALGPRLRVAAAARYSYLDRILEGAIDPELGDFYPIPRYQDVQAKATVTLRKDEEVGAMFLYGGDALRRTIPSADPAAKRSETTDASFYRVMLRYTRVDPSGASVEVTPFFGKDVSDVRTAFGAVPTELDVSSLRYGTRMLYRSKVATRPRVTVAAGMDLSGSASSVTRAGSVTLPPREGDVVVFGQPPGDDVNADDWTAHVLDVAPHVSTDIEVGPFTITPGLRLDAFLIQSSRLTPKVGLTPQIGSSRLEPTVDPRLSVRFRASDRLAYTLSGGLYHQPPEPEDLSAVFGNPILSPSRAIHLSAAQSLRITRSLSADMVVFYKSLDELVMRSRLITPPLARALNQNGEGRSYGVSWLLRQELWKGFFGWVSYAMTRSERQYDVDPTARLFDFDQPHVFGVVASQEWRRWVLGARFRYASGMPRTPIIGAFYEARGDQYQPIFGAHNTTRLPSFYQLDLRLERSFPIGSATLDAFVDVQNITYRRNPEEITYSYDFGKADYITGLPTLAVVGARLEF